MTEQAVIRIDAGGRAYEQAHNAHVLHGLRDVLAERCESGKVTRLELSVTEGRDGGSIADFEVFVLLGPGSSFAIEFPRGFVRHPSVSENVVPTLHEAAESGHTITLDDALSSLIYDDGAGD